MFLQISFILWTFPIPYHGLKVGTYYIPTIINLGTYYGNFNAMNTPAYITTDSFANKIEKLRKTNYFAN